jgi:hypothetical protein
MKNTILIAMLILIGSACTPSARKANAKEMNNRLNGLVYG